MNFILMPSLEQIALVKITTMLWNQDDIRRQLDHLLHQRNLFINDNFFDMIRKVEDKVSKLPQSVQEKISGYIKPIGREISKFLFFIYVDTILQDFSKFTTRTHTFFQFYFFWTQHGTLDGKKTVQTIVKNDRIDIWTRYKWACDYCLETDIRELWEKISNDKLNFQVDKRRNFLLGTNRIGDFFTYDINRNTDLAEYYGINENISPQSAFEHAVEYGWRVATVHFWKKLSFEEKEKSLDTIAGKIRDAEMMCFLFSQVDEERQMKLFQRLHTHVLQSFLDSPLWKSFFLDVAMRMCHSYKGYREVLEHIIQKLRKSSRDYNYHDLFSKVWQSAPDDFKSRIHTDARIFKSFLHSLFEVRGADNIKLVLENATLSDKRKALMDNRFMCEDLIRDAEWDLLKLLLEECKLSAEEMLKFKLNLRFTSDFQKDKDKREKFLQVTNDCVCE